MKRFTIVTEDGEQILLNNSTLKTLLAGEDQDNDVLSVETKFGYVAVDRTTTDVAIGITGAAGDILQRIIVESVTTTDAEIYDGTSAAGQLIATIPAATAAGTIFEIGCMCTTNWTLALHATDAAALICIGRFS